MPDRILVIDDDPSVRASLSEALADEGMDVTVAEDGVRALAAIAGRKPDVVICDVRMPEMDGLAVLDAIRERAPGIDVILMTAFDDMETVVRAMRAGAAEFLVKPVGFEQLLAVTTRVLDDRKERRRASAADALRPVGLGELIGHDPGMIDVYKLVGQAAATRATVLIRGESGTGKELVARAIHRHSAAAAEPFVAVNCASLPSTLLETELFGHVRGAYTGAHEARRGRFSLAGNGTIFLDEIGDTSPDFQTKLLRVVQDHEFQPVGAERSERTEARVIAATHQNLEAMIARRTFREDLYYRLRVVEIVIPPLRDRAGDILLLASHLIHRAAVAVGAKVPVLSAEAAERLTAYDWPGNVRELENTLMRAVVTAAGSVIRAGHVIVSGSRGNNDAPLSSLDDVEREQVVRVLAATSGHKGRAADILGISRPRLTRLMKKYSIDR